MSPTHFGYIFLLRNRILPVASGLSGEQGVSKRYAAERYNSEVQAGAVAAERIYSK